MNTQLKRLVFFICVQFLVLNSSCHAKTFAVKFQSDIVGPHLAFTDVWIEYIEKIPPVKEFTSCQWVKIKYFNFKYAACLWSYCMVKDDQMGMKCLRICMKSVWSSANRDLSFSVQIPSIDDAEDVSQDISSYAHRSWSHLCWSFSSKNGKNKFYYNGNLIGQNTLDPTTFNLAILDSKWRNCYLNHHY